ncbi:immunity protein Tsi6 family protein [Pantoea rwandensis]|uniref:Tsi6 domain-containing protein n=1 Tax=Pantoea rwandensis TaxID=1076550 RepID=A0A1X1D1D5_9GAMM|nr:hypothetical protein HA51_06915 [Pantoea rwandensis]
MHGANFIVIEQDKSHYSKVNFGYQVTKEFDTTDFEMAKYFINANYTASQTGEGLKLFRLHQADPDYE